MSSKPDLRLSDVQRGQTERVMLIKAAGLLTCCDIFHLEHTVVINHVLNVHIYCLLYGSAWSEFIYLKPFTEKAYLKSHFFVISTLTSA